MDHDESVTDGSQARDAAESGDGADPDFVTALVRDSVVVVGSVALVALLLVAVSGVWPPLVAVESGSMEPHIHTGDMVFVMTEGRFPGPDARHGVVTTRQADSYEQFAGDGDVIVFAPNGNADRTPIIHRAMFYVEAGENWYDRAEPGAVGGADNCTELADCPAPHAGFVTKGDAVETYDQVQPTTSTVVRPSWVVGTAEVRIPGLGWLRLSV